MLSDKEAERLYHLIVNKAMGYARAWLPYDDAYEASHLVAVDIITERSENADYFDESGSTSRLIYRKVRSRIVDDYRGILRKKQVEEVHQNERVAGALSWGNPAQAAESRELGKVVRDAIDALPERRRTAFLLVRQHEMTYQEAADQMALGVGTVHTHVSRALAAIRAAVEGLEGPPRPERQIASPNAPRRLGARSSE
jgi:RNA polymerase sigma factor (sigma-70 family)